MVLRLDSAVAEFSNDIFRDGIWREMKPTAEP